MKNVLSKPDRQPVQIKTKYQNAKEVKTHFVSDEEVASDLGPDYDISCSQLAYEPDIRNAKERIHERQKKKLIKVIL